MPKKKVGVSLRKPPQAPEDPSTQAVALVEPERRADSRATEPAPMDVDSFVSGSSNGGEPASGPGQSEHSNRHSRMVARSARTVGTPLEATRSGALGAPPCPTTESAHRPESAAGIPAIPAREAIGGVQAGGYREVTVYLPIGLARRLSLHCARNNMDISRLVQQVLEARLAPKAARRTGSAWKARRLRHTARRGLLRLARRVRVSLESGGELRLRAPARWLGEVLANNWLPTHLLAQLRR